MPIPDFQSIMRPLLELASDGKDHALSDAREELANTFHLTEDEKKALLPSGRQLLSAIVSLGREFISVRLEPLTHHAGAISGSRAVAESYCGALQNA